jgi:hypothetical protein
MPWDVCRINVHSFYSIQNDTLSRPRRPKFSEFGVQGTRIGRLRKWGHSRSPLNGPAYLELCDIPDPSFSLAILKNQKSHGLSRIRGTRGAYGPFVSDFPIIASWTVASAKTPSTFHSVTACRRDYSLNRIWQSLYNEGIYHI